MVGSSWENLRSLWPEVYKQRLGYHLMGISITPELTFCCDQEEGNTGGECGKSTVGTSACSLDNFPCAVAELCEAVSTVGCEDTGSSLPQMLSGGASLHCPQRAGGPTSPVSGSLLSEVN